MSFDTVVNTDSHQYLSTPNVGPGRPDLALLSAASGQLLDPLQALLTTTRSPHTQRAYARDVADFFGQVPDVGTVAGFLQQRTPAIAQDLHRYKAQLLGRGLAEATINRRLYSVRALLKMAHRLGLCGTNGTDLVDREKVRPYRDTRGISADDLARLVDHPSPDSVKGLRDRAILALLAANALRRGELCALNLEDWQPENRTLAILGKGRGLQKELITVSHAAAAALGAYLAATPDRQPHEPLFRSAHRARHFRRQRLTTNGLYHVVGVAGAKSGAGHLTPHKIRHSAITLALDLTGGDVRRVQKLSRHASPSTLLLYDDARENHQGAITELIAARLAAL